MTALTYVCLSDLHLGADYSVLTSMRDDGTITLREPSPTLAALGTGLRRSVTALSGTERPTLILLGDVLDLGLSPAGDVAQAFRRFIEALFPADGPPVFSTQVLCVPGNHDHHLWRSAQDESFLDRLPADGGRGDMPDLLEQTPLFERQTVVCRLMTQLMRGYPHLKDATVHVAYPNLGLLDEARSRCVVLHHGHYVDATYRAMSTINAELTGQGARPATVAQIERENGAWVDFLWSDLGSSGAIARDATTLYETMRDAAAAHEFSQTLSAALLARLSGVVGVGPDTPIAYGVTVSNAVKGLIDATLVRGAQSERDSYASVMSADSVADLRWYLGGPVRREIADAGKLAASRDTSFVFGHTHKPFQDQLTVAGFAQPVAIYNTGGWVMDQPTMAPAQGAAAVFIDDELNVASLRLFNDTANGESAPVRAAGVGGFRDRDNPLLARMNEALGSTASDWQAFSAHARAAVELHARVLLQTFFEPKAVPAGRSR